MHNDSHVVNLPSGRCMICLEIEEVVRAQRERDAQKCRDRAQELRRLPATEQVEPVYLALEACARAIRQGGDRGKQPDFADDPWMG